METLLSDAKAGKDALPSTILISSKYKRPTTGIRSLKVFCVPWTAEF